MKRGVAGLITAAVLLLGAASASAANISVADHPKPGYTEFTLTSPGCPFLMSCGSDRVAIYYKGVRKLVSTHNFDNDQYPGNTDFVDYMWSCDRPGNHNWHAIVRNANGDPADDRHGTIVVPACGARVNRPVGRGKANAKARSFWPAETVTDLHCVATSTVTPGGLAARWSCTLTHANQTRECDERYLLRFWKRSMFGGAWTNRGSHSQRHKIACRSL